MLHDVMAEVLPLLADHSGDRTFAPGTPDHWTLTAMTHPHHGAELIPFDQVHRLVQERRQRTSALADPDAGSLVATRTSQVRRLLAEHRAVRPPSGPEVA